MKYRVIFTKYEVYEVEADNAWEAEDKAYALCDADAYAWEGSADEVIVEEMLDQYISKEAISCRSTSMDGI